MIIGKIFVDTRKNNSYNVSKITTSPIDVWNFNGHRLAYLTSTKTILRSLIKKYSISFIDIPSLFSMSLS